MRILKSCALVFVGLVAGIGVSAWMTPAHARQGGGAGTRLVITQAGGAQTPGNIPTQALYFIKDSRSNGCWLGSAGVGGGVALTVAPKEACD
jgi:hypothetical protein